jgi:glycosyltransferase involved in cell wall biosynthesis
MNSGYPLMVSSCDPLRRIVSESDCGLVFEAENPVDFADKVRFAMKSPELIQKYVINGKAAIQNGRWNWESDSQELLRLYSELL